MDLYEILELKPNASESEIKKSYIRLIKIYHPDKNNNDSTMYQKIQSAYEILINPNTRQEYHKMGMKEKVNFIDILERIIRDNISMKELEKYNIKLNKNDIEYLQNNFINFFKMLNVGEIFEFFKKGIVPKKNYNNIIDCSESDSTIFDNKCAEYFNDLPISLQKPNNLDIVLDINIKIGDINSNSLKKIKIKRNIDDEDVITTFIFNLNKPYIIFIGGGDMLNGNYGNLIIKLKLPKNTYWQNDIIIVEQEMTLYEMIYGININLNFGNNNNINIDNWVPSRDGFLIKVNNIGIKLCLNYDNNENNQKILKQYFS